MEPPRRFTCPFRYVPHPLCVTAAREVRSYLDRQPQWRDELADGKMMGVLVVDDGKGNRGFLAAFSGTLEGGVVHDYFVPPVYDIYAPASEFRRGEREITALNRRIEDLDQDPQLLKLQRQLNDFDEQQRQRESEFAMRRDEAKRRRDAVRAAGATDEELRRLIAESQWFKAEMKRIRRKGQDKRAALQEQIDNLRQAIQAFKHERKTMSEELQGRIFVWFEVVNARGEHADLLEIFERERHCLPPAGAGECCAPRLLQYAFTHGLRPLCMAEFWVGTDNGLRRDGNFYPACESKCRPILNFMLQGLDVDDPYSLDEEVKIPVIYEDEWMMVVNKPAGVLSVPGRDGRPDVAVLLGGSHAFLQAAHRLDMDTSGVILIAKTRPCMAALTEMFTHGHPDKSYLTLVKGNFTRPKGVIDIPLAEHEQSSRSRAMNGVNMQTAVTRYRVIGPGALASLVECKIETGRTHQIRRHMVAMGHPVAGDRRHGDFAFNRELKAQFGLKRMFLHARRIVLNHPLNGTPLTIEAPLPDELRNVLASMGLEGEGIR